MVPYQWGHTQPPIQWPTNLLSQGHKGVPPYSMNWSVSLWLASRLPFLESSHWPQISGEIILLASSFLLGSPSRPSLPGVLWWWHYQGVHWHLHNDWGDNKCFFLLYCYIYTYGCVVPSLFTYWYLYSLVFRSSIGTPTICCYWSYFWALLTYFFGCSWTLIKLCYSCPIRVHWIKSMHLVHWTWTLAKFYSNLGLIWRLLIPKCHTNG